MLMENALELCKRRLLGILDCYAGIEAQQQQLVIDVQIGGHPNARPDDIAQALQSLADQDHASRRKDTYRGWVWRITPDGHRAAAALALED